MTSAEVFLFFFFTTWIDLKSPNSPSPWRGGFSTTAMCVPTRRNGVWHAWYYVAGVAGSGRSCCDSVAAAFWGNHGVSGWTGRKRRVFNCETSVQAVDWAMNHQETTGKPTFFDHEWGNQELIFFMTFGHGQPKIGPNNGLHIQEGWCIDSSRLPFPNLQGGGFPSYKWIIIPW